MAEIRESLNSLGSRIFDARPDTIDFRDQMYEPALVEVPTQLELQEYKAFGVPILNQGVEGACTGFGLATVANYLLRKRKSSKELVMVSPRMLYEMAKRYDEWPGENYSGSSARGAMKGWHKHGVCAEALWPYKSPQIDFGLTHERVADAATRPLGAYYRVNHKDLVSMHSALAEVGVLFATSWVHQGWEQVTQTGLIPYQREFNAVGGHAFAIVAYDENGFWIQNSWGKHWGIDGFAQISYDDWLVFGTDVWVARLGVPVSLRIANRSTLTIAPTASQAKAASFFELHSHVISFAGNGSLETEGMFASPQVEVAEIFENEIPRLTAEWEKKRLLLFVPGGLNNLNTFTQRAGEYRKAMLDAQIYPLIFNWNLDFWSMITVVLQEALRRRRPEDTLSSRMDFMLDRLDDTLEPLVSALGKTQWGELKQRAYQAALAGQGGLPFVLKALKTWMERTEQAEVHLVAHSLGSVFSAPVIQLLTGPERIRRGPLHGKSGYGLKLSTCTLWAPAIHLDDFHAFFTPAIRKGLVEQFTIYTLSDQADQDDNVAKIYNKSLLYLISNALEEKRSQPIAGMEKFLQADKRLTQMVESRQIEWVRAPNNAPLTSRFASTASRHGDFDDDVPTLRSTLARILQPNETPPEFNFGRSNASLREKRQQLDEITRS